MSKKGRMMDNYVKIMFDYSCTCLWDREGQMIEKLPVSDDLQKDIEAWVRSSDAHAWEWQSLAQSFDDIPSDGTALRMTELDILCDSDFASGIDIAYRIKSQLPGWCVMFRNYPESPLLLPMNEEGCSEII